MTDAHTVPAAAQPPVTNRSAPVFLTNRAWWLVPLLVWAIAVGGSLYVHLADLHRQALEVAIEGARNMFRMVVLVRAWNADHGGVYVPVSPKVQPNPYLEHPRRDLVTTDGQALTMVNPAFMTRLLAEMAAANGGTIFHITSLKPIRPANAADEWERRALQDFERGAEEAVELVSSPGGLQLRYMAPLLVAQPCMKCHEKQGYRVGDIRGGISVSHTYSPVAGALAGQRQTYAIHGAVFLLVAAVGVWLLELLRRRRIGLATTIGTLEATQEQLASSNRSLAEALDAAATASRAKSVFLSVMSHELRTPLNTIAGFAHLLRRETDRIEHRQMLDSIDSASSRLVAMIEEMLDFSRLDGEVFLDTADFKLDDLLAGLLAVLGKAANGKDIGCRLERDPNLPAYLRGDARRIGQLVGCFISNAVKFSERGEIVLRAVCLEDEGLDIRLRFEVEDHGVGIGPQQQNDLFQPFHQVDMSSTRKFGGTGLGLALCKRLATLMGGEVGVSSVLGAGSRFWFDVTLPIGRPRESRPAELSGGEASAAPAAALLPQLETLLMRDDMDAAVLWRDHAELLRPLLGDQAAAVERELGAFRFDVALAALRQATRNGRQE